MEENLIRAQKLMEEIIRMTPPSPEVHVISFTEKSWQVYLKTIRDFLGIPTFNKQLNTNREFLDKQIHKSFSKQEVFEHSNINKLWREAIKGE